MPTAIISATPACRDGRDDGALVYQNVSHALRYVVKISAFSLTLACPAASFAISGIQFSSLVHLVICRSISVAL
jgi:hypothetical protein